MEETWEGFTPEEITKISNKKNVGPKSDKGSNSPVKKMIFKQNTFGKKNNTRERMLKSSNNLTVTSDAKVDLPSGARLYIAQIPEEDEIEEPEMQGGEKSAQREKLPESEVKSQSKENSLRTSSIGEVPSLPSKLPELLSSPREADLEDFEKRQKMIQEQNRRRKECLRKALEDRTKKTHEEARRLGEIEEELKKLDVQLSNDVSILRNQIEVASLDFMEAQKRFDRAEREYLDAKLALFTKRERKELLTGHLCTIIEQNELRKAKKLSDLMDKLQLASVVIVKPFEAPENGENVDMKEDQKSNVPEPPK
ncbi:RAB6-interacting golgin [Macrosteles quadrilineatus]|uniref:RAB6-interacting golgin n=1 Tax=Macrosteles quadrilineatus TaxID=74068 RepID=UPI0023E1AE7F|nr:RAB6-interacting golgin [Macrosteles quadrilineatus]